VFDAHDKAFQFYGGVCRRGIYDNMKTAVEAILVARHANTIGAFCRCARIT
jgi:transposase